MLRLFSALLLAALLSGCTPEIGSPDWCEQKAAQNKSEWTFNDAREYATSCVFESTASQDDTGSEAWCEALEQQPKGNWTANEAADYARHCIIRLNNQTPDWCQTLIDTPKGEWTLNDATRFARHCLINLE